MSGISHLAMFHTSQIEVTFFDDIGNSKVISGTGFWVKKGATSYFVTNAHNVNPTMKLGSDTKFQLNKIRILLRMTFGIYLPNTKLCTISSYNLKCHETADVAILSDVVFSDAPPHFQYSTFLHSDLADTEFLSKSLQAMDMASFIGFPGTGNVVWYDEAWKVPIARTINLASLPSIPFTNAQILTSDVSLVSGLSFSGSSGSPVISHSKGLNVGEGLTGGNYIPPKVIGIMSGHWRDHEPAMFSHSGLSYFTRSPSILSLL